ncbi:MAG TPA: hypothetical protein VF813_06980, partial [Anaerolineaceae bacterium]
LFLLFNFNGHLLSHTSVGHETWGGYFLFPWFAALVFLLIDGDHSWGWVAKMALLLFFMYLNGSFHQFVWSLLFLLVFAAASWKNALPALKAVFFALLISLVRILPPALMAGEYARQTFFFGGYPSLLTLLNGLVSVELPTKEVPVPFSTYVLGWWEYSLYIGLVGALFVAVFGVNRWLRRRPDGAGHYELLVPSLALVILSIGQDYEVVRLFKIPLFNGELVSTRIISLSFVFLVILAAVEFQRWMESKPLPAAINAGMVGVLILGVRDLWEYARTWRLDTASTFFPQQLPAFQKFTVANRPDEAYLRLIILGAVGTLAGMAVLAVLAWLEKRGTLRRAASRLRPAALNGPSRSPDGLSEQARWFLAEILAPGGRQAAAEAAPVQNES